MEINDKLLEKLSQLSALSFHPKEKDQMKKYLRETLSHFEKIKTIDTNNIEPLVSPLNPSLKLRKDELNDFPDKENLLDQAPQKQGLLVKVPPSI